MHLVFWKLQLSSADVFVGEQFYFLEADYLRADQDVAVGMGGSVGNRSARTGRNLAETERSMLRSDTKWRGVGVVRGRCGFQNAHLRVANGVGVVIDVHF